MNFPTQKKKPVGYYYLMEKLRASGALIKINQMTAGKLLMENCIAKKMACINGQTLLQKKNMQVLKFSLIGKLVKALTADYYIMYRKHTTAPMKPVPNIN